MGKRDEALHGSGGSLGQRYVGVGVSGPALHGSGGSLGQRYVTILIMLDRLAVNIR